MSMEVEDVSASEAPRGRGQRWIPVEGGWVGWHTGAEDAAMRGIQFLTDEKGQKTSVLIDLKVHKGLWEDFQDVLVSRSRRREKDIPIKKIRAELIASGELRG